MDLTEEILKFSDQVSNITEETFCGSVTSTKGTIIKSVGISSYLAIGYKCYLETRQKERLLAEVIGFDGEYSILMSFESIEDIGPSCMVYFRNQDKYIYPDSSWIGRILDGMGKPLDEKGALKNGPQNYKLKNKPPNAYKKNRVGEKVNLGVKSINCFTSCCLGQRMGIFAGSGVGKSVLISMLTKFSDFDVKIVGLIGERGRELQEFIQDSLGGEALEKAVIIASTSDQSALMRRQATYLTLTIAEYFRDQGKKVLCIIDSITRFAMAQREIGLALGELPSSKGYTPSVFSELPKILERAGPGEQQGSITGLFSVLVEGDDHNEPISDAVRGILDGHIVLERSIADNGRFPAINILKSLSRTMPNCNNSQENEIISLARKYISNYNNIEDLYKIGAYRKGTDKDIDLAIYYQPFIENFLKQSPHDQYELEQSYRELAAAIGYNYAD